MPNVIGKLNWWSRVDVGRGAGTGVTRWRVMNVIRVHAHPQSSSYQYREF